MLGFWCLGLWISVEVQLFSCFRALLMRIKRAHSVPERWGNLTARLTLLAARCPYLCSASQWASWSSLTDSSLGILYGFDLTEPWNKHCWTMIRAKTNLVEVVIVTCFQLLPGLPHCLLSKRVIVNENMLTSRSQGCLGHFHLVPPCEEERWHI